MRVLVIAHAPTGTPVASGMLRAKILKLTSSEVFEVTQTTSTAGSSFKVKQRRFLKEGPKAEIVGWAKALSPDMVFVELRDDLEILELAEELSTELEAPLLVYLLDNWISLLRGSIERDRKVVRLLDSLVRRAAFTWVISREMKDWAAEKWPSKKWVEVRNFVSWPTLIYKLAPWVPANGGLTYSGALAENMTRESVAFVTQTYARWARQSLNKAPKTLATVHTHKHWKEAGKSIAKERGVELKYIINGKGGYRQVLKRATSLLVAYNFDRVSHDYVSLSFPNKFPELLQTYKPLLVYGPPDLPIMRFCREHHSESWGVYLVHDSNGLIPAFKKINNGLSRATRLYRREVIRAHFSDRFISSAIRNDFDRLNIPISRREFWKLS